MLRIAQHSIKRRYPSSAARPSTIETAAAILLALLLPLMLLACDKGSAATAGRDVIVVIASGSRNEPEPELGAPDLAILSDAATSSDDTIAYVVSQNTGQPIEVPLTPMRPDGQVDHGPDRQNRITANLDEIQRLVRNSAADMPFDLLSFIAEAVRVTPTPGTLIVVSSGLSTAGAFDLRMVGWGAHPAAVAADLKHGGTLPNLAHWHVVFSNLGTTTKPQEPLPLAQRAELTSYWLAICKAGGAASCQVDAVTRANPPSRSTRPVPLVSLPGVTPVQGPDGWAGPSIPADTFFAFGSYLLLPGADVIVGPIAERAISEPADIEILGFASPDGGSPAFNSWLSLKRAEAVESRLIDLGVPASQIVRVVGEGTAGMTPAACYRDGQLDEVVCGQLRRVEVLLSPSRY
jgi:outer membrane protein OmpA-like peptidoglycan-associated protein